jgi:hypothetical protein
MFFSLFAKHLDCKMRVIKRTTDFQNQSKTTLIDPTNVNWGEAARSQKVDALCAGLQRL